MSFPILRLKKKRQKLVLIHNSIYIDFLIIKRVGGWELYQFSEGIDLRKQANMNGIRNLILAYAIKVYFSRGSSRIA